MIPKKLRYFLKKFVFVQCLESFLRISIPYDCWMHVKTINLLFESICLVRRHLRIPEQQQQVQYVLSDNGAADLDGTSRAAIDACVAVKAVTSTVNRELGLAVDLPQAINRARVLASAAARAKVSVNVGVYKTNT